MGLKMGAGSSTAGAGGTLSDIHHRIQCVRFIPAGAGNTRLSVTSNSSLPVYPRWRGEHIQRKLRNLRRNGLSPLAQGTLYVYFCVRCASRFIPAGAGNTSPSTPVSKLISVYPRWRREHAELEPALPLLPGLSPLAQGTLSPMLPRSIFRRFIPAGAGNTPTYLLVSRTDAVYPRWRREHPLLAGQKTNPALSPQPSTCAPG